MPIKNKTTYDKIKTKLTVNNTGNNSNKNNVFSNYNKMKLLKEKTKTIFNKTFNTINTTGGHKKSFHLKCKLLEKKSDKKVNQFTAKINKFSNKNTLNNNKDSFNEKSFDFAQNIDKRYSMADNSNFLNFSNQKYMDTINKNNKNKKEKESSKNIYFQLSNNKNNLDYNNSINDGNKADLISKKKTFTKKNTSGNVINSLSEIKDKRNKIINIFKKNKKVTSKEEAYYILATSPLLRLTEQIIFSRATNNVKKVLSIDTILGNHKVFMRNKKNELMNEISLCEKRIKIPFTASKIADITLNFITSSDEEEFKELDMYETNNDIITTYNIFIKILYILFDLEYDNKSDGKKMKKYLFDKVKEKGFAQIRDYLYHIYIAKKERINIAAKIDKINQLMEKSPILQNFHESMKICRFTGFTIYLIQEIIVFGNNIKDTFELKYKAKNLLDIVKEKSEKLEYKNIKSKLNKQNKK